MVSIKHLRYLRREFSPHCRYFLTAIVSEDFVSSLLFHGGGDSTILSLFIPASTFCGCSSGGADSSSSENGCEKDFFDGDLLLDNPRKASNTSSRLTMEDAGFGWLLIVGLDGSDVLVFSSSMSCSS